MVMAQHSKILIVDDDSEMLDLIAEHFSIFGFKVLKANSGNEAIQALSEHDVNIIISDIHMEEGNGLELLQAVKKNNVFKPNFYFISGFADHNLKEVLSIGADGLFFKPFDASTLRASIKKSLLPRKSHWSTKPCDTEALKKINLSKDNTHWGRGGFSCLVNESISVGEFINFKSSWDDGEINGTGRTVWVDDSRVGIEIDYLKIDSIELYEQFLKKKLPISYIPA